MTGNEYEKEVFEGIIHDVQPEKSVDWLRHVPGLDLAKAQVAGVEAIDAGRWMAVMENTAGMYRGGLGNVVSFGEFASMVAQVRPDLAPLLRDCQAELVAIMHRSVARYVNQPRP